MFSSPLISSRPVAAGVVVEWVELPGSFRCLLPALFLLGLLRLDAMGGLADREAANLDSVGAGHGGTGPGTPSIAPRVRSPTDT